MNWVICIFILNTLAVLVLAVREARRPIRALTWVLISAVIPLLGICLYAILSFPIQIKRPTFSTQDGQQDQEMPVGPTSRKLIAAISRMTGNRPRNGTVRPLTDGQQTYEAMLDALRRANQSIDMEFYIYRDDHVGRRVTDVLIDRAQHGVQVRFLRDGLGSRKFPKSEIARLSAAGVSCKTFFPARFPWVGRRINHRDHCKIVVIDKNIGFVGGINIGDEYAGLKAKIGPWRDTHLRVEGACVEQIRHVFEMNWEVATEDRATTRKSDEIRPPKSIDESERHITREVGAAETNVPVQTVEGGPDRPAQSMRALFFLCLTQAQKRIDITTPYFVPDTDVTMALKTSIMRGVKIRLLVPFEPDHKLIGLASRTYYPELLEAGIEIYQFTGGVLHAKVMTVDDEVSIIGAANYDLRSFRLNFEIATVMYSSAIAKQLTDQFDRDIRHAVPMKKADLANQSAWSHILERGSRLLAPLL